MRKLLFASVCLLVAIVAQAARVDTIHVASSRVPDGMNVTVITPDRQKGNVRFPSVYLLNGYDGNNLSWTKTRKDLPSLADSYGFVFILPDGMDSWYWDSPIQPEMQMESFITQELVPFIDRNYPTIPNPSKRAITGLSMGGHGALWLAIRHPDLFGSAGSMSGGVDIRPFPKNWKMAKWLGPKESNEERWDQMTVISLVPSLKPGELNITVDCGVDDFFIDVNRNLHKALMEAGTPHDYTERPGAHTHKYWSNSLLYHLAFFNEAFHK